MSESTPVRVCAQNARHSNNNSSNNSCFRCCSCTVPQFPDLILHGAVTPVLAVGHRRQPLQTAGPLPVHHQRPLQAAAPEQVQDGPLRLPLRLHPEVGEALPRVDAGAMPGTCAVWVHGNVLGGVRPIFKEPGGSPPTLKFPPEVKNWSVHGISKIAPEPKLGLRRDPPGGLPR